MRTERRTAPPATESAARTTSQNPTTEVPCQSTAKNVSKASAVDTDWVAEAKEAIQLLATTGDTFTTDSIRELGVCEPSNPQRWAALIHAMSTTGAITCVGTTLGVQPNGKLAPTRLWRGTHKRNGGQARD